MLTRHLSHRLVTALLITVKTATMNAENVGQVGHSSTWEEEAGEPRFKDSLSYIKTFKASLGSMRP